MGFRLTADQSELLSKVAVALAAKATPQIRFFWRELRKEVMPPVPERGKKQTALQYAAVQTRWQRVVALSADSHVAAKDLLKQEIELDREIEAIKKAEADAKAAKKRPISEADLMAESMALLGALPESMFWVIVKSEIERRRPGWWPQ